MTGNSIRAVSALLVALAVALSGCAAGDVPWASEPRSPRPSPGVPTSRHTAPSPLQAGEPITDITDVVGAWGMPSETSAPGSPYIVISADGTASGSDGCNIFGGMAWEADASTIAFTGGVQTLAACPSLDQWLNQRATAIINHDVMTFFDDAGFVIGTLRRAG